MSERDSDQAKSLDVIVRLHDPSRSFELRRCIFGLVCQSYRPLTIILVTQRFSETQFEQLRTNLAPTLAIDGSVQFKMANYSKPLPTDARAALLNLGLREAHGRYVAFLDHDDSIFPQAYGQLIQELTDADCAIAFGSIAVKDVDVFQDALLIERRTAVYKGKNVFDLFDDNFCPIHSFVIDRQKASTEDLFFDESLCKLEDYDFLLRFCAQYESSFRLLGTFVGDYYIKNDGSNTMTSYSTKCEEILNDWKRSGEAVRELKRKTLLSVQVQRQLGIVPADPGMTISKLLRQFASE
jgi:hypothetical protein